MVDSDVLERLRADADVPLTSEGIPEGSAIGYRFTYIVGGVRTEWFKTAEELLVPNGDEPLIAYMLREIEKRGGIVQLETVWWPDADLREYYRIVRP